MEEMKIDLGKIGLIADKFFSLEQDLKEYSDRIEDVSEDLKKNCSVSMNFLCEKIGFQNKEILNEAASIDNFLDALDAIITKYSETEKLITGYKNTAGNSENGIIQKHTESVEIPYKSPLSDVDDLKKKIENLKKILKALHKGTDDPEVKASEKMLSYLEKLLDFITGDKKGITGASDWFDLADSSINVWSALYDYYQKKYDNLITGLFGRGAQRNVKIAGVTAGFFALIASVLSASNGIDEKEWQDKIADYVDCGKEVLTIVNAEYSLKHIGDTNSLAKMKEGCWSALDIYIALGKSAVGMVSQGIRSLGKYSADGEWSAYDTGATGIDVSVAGIYGLAHNLTYGLDDFFYGMIDRVSGGHKPADMSYGQMAAEGYKALAKKAGEAIGNLYNKFKK